MEYEVSIALNYDDPPPMIDSATFKLNQYELNGVYPLINDREIFVKVSNYSIINRIGYEITFRWTKDDDEPFRGIKLLLLTVYERAIMYPYDERKTISRSLREYITDKSNRVMESKDTPLHVFDQTQDDCELFATIDIAYSQNNPYHQIIDFNITILDGISYIIGNMEVNVGTKTYSIGRYPFSMINQIGNNITISWDAYSNMYGVSISITNVVMDERCRNSESNSVEFFDIGRKISMIQQNVPIQLFDTITVETTTVMDTIIEPIAIIDTTTEDYDDDDQWEQIPSNSMKVLNSITLIVTTILLYATLS